MSSTLFSEIWTWEIRGKLKTAQIQHWTEPMHYTVLTSPMASRGHKATQCVKHCAKRRAQKWMAFCLTSKCKYRTLITYSLLLFPSRPGLKSNGLAHYTQQAQDVADPDSGLCGSLREGNQDQDQPASTLYLRGQAVLLSPLLMTI